MNFKIQEPDHELTIGYITLVIKYAVLIFVSWIAGWLIFLILPYKGRVRAPRVEDKIENGYLISIFIALVVIAYYTYRLYKKSRYGLLKEITFREDEVELVVMNQLNGRSRTHSLPSELFRVEENETNHYLFGEQRIYSLKEGERVLTILNVDLTAWKRNSETENLIREFRKFT